MPFTLSILSGVLLGIFLWCLWKSTCVPECEFLSDTQLEGEEFRSCPMEFVAMLFGGDDWEFVSEFKSKPLNALFLAERKSLASAWVRATAGSVHRIMRDHTLISRRSSDLEIWAEFQIYLQYIALQAACAFLLVSIRLLGPVRMNYLSQYVYRVSERLSYAHQALKAATKATELPRVWHA
jgi:hypothetical protein